MNIGIMNSCANISRVLTLSINCLRKNNPIKCQYIYAINLRFICCFLLLKNFHLERKSQLPLKQIVVTDKQWGSVSMDVCAKMFFHTEMIN